MLSLTRIIALILMTMTKKKVLLILYMASLSLWAVAQSAL